MAAYIKFDGIGGQSYVKIGDIKTYPKPTGYTDAGRRPQALINWSSNAKTSLKDAGMTPQGIRALTNGGQVSNKDDQAIVNAILASILN